eukprot:3679696-Amphidinium_carterae.2
MLLCTCIRVTLEPHATHNGSYAKGRFRPHIQGARTRQSLNSDSPISSGITFPARKQPNYNV